ncbi:FtsX-like permease family protein [Streptococcus sp. IsoGale021]|uniref:FtsX-like permease family protein n=1 Tax=Streptococcus TaxID=1301 RepID=UPI0020015009|nr:MULTISPECIES: FtsX-like permease family protein [Streptococcus]MCY7210951.1 FtsX-like permease family protein [Streptococcus anginosus]MCY7212175.1 FtsX-like permease family protein [Streptococcus anginosus]MCY7227284.1 FtsX-like permease family protein [Streptococcus anginosus]MDQ8694880.1 FtsX-like permease family protein [Streptococcus sp. IsoGale021]MDU5129392.1 FtsX-like permease family protein [Streptococcus anginosus]
MFKLTNKLAVSNLIKNRSLYYPFALATIVATAILYSFVSLAYSPNLEASYGGSAARMTLQFGIWVVQIAVLILITYANSFVMKNRSRELGLYSILGMEKRHMLLMTFFEMFYFFLVTVGLGIGLGFLLDKLLFAVLLKFMGMKVVIASTFQWSNIFTVLASLGVAFALILFLNSTRLLRYSSLHLMREKKAGEKKGRFLGLQTLVGLGFLAAAYYIALTVEKPVAAILNFFIAVLMVVLATYLLFNAGTITLLQFLKKRKQYYYKTQNFISVSNLISRMRKNAAGLATISILSTMLLVTLVGSINIYVGGKDYLTTLYPKDYNIMVTSAKTDKNAAILQAVKEVARGKGLTDAKYEDYSYQISSISKINGNQLTIPENTARLNVEEAQKSMATFLVISRQEYEKMTGKTVDLADNEALLYAKNLQINQKQVLTINGKSWNIKEHLKTDFAHGKIVNTSGMVSEKGMYMVVNQPSQVGLKSFYTYYIGIQSSNKQVDLQESIFNALQQQGQESGNISLSERYHIEKEYQGVIGTLLFIGIFLSTIFLLGTVLVIYYKQISEGYEDREGFIILQKVGLDEKQTKATIRKQILTVFFLPLIFAFLHIAVAFHMLQLIVALLGATNVPLLIQTTIATCGVFLLVYILVFVITSRSYQKIVAR